MNEQLTRWWEGLQPRERWILALGATVVACTLLYLLLDPLFRGVGERAQRVAEKEELLAWVQRGAAQLPKAGASAVAPETAPVIIVNRTLQAAGLGPYLKQAQPAGQGETGVKTQFQAVPFDTLVMWLSQIASQHGLRVDSAQLDTAGRPGTTDARVSLARGAS
jgi:type II secretory pathway component PulM